MTYRVRFAEPDVHYRRLKPEIDRTIQDVLARGDLICRRDLENFERHLAGFVGTRYAVGLNSGFHALHLALIAAGVGRGAEVIVPAHTFVACVSAVVHTGATPVLVDVGSDYNLDVDACRTAVTPRTRAVMPVHLNGRMCEMDALMDLARQHGLVVIEDAAQALGATTGNGRAGAFGLAGCFSFYPFKLLGAFGDAGAITTNDERVATVVRRLRHNGEDRATGEYHGHGFTCLMDNLQAAVLDLKLKHLPAWLARRRQVAEAYRHGLTGVGDLRLPHFADPRRVDVFQNYVIRTSRRDALVEFLDRQGVETLVHWRKPLWRHAALQLGEHALPATEAVCREVLSLPMNAEIGDADVQAVIDAVVRFFDT
jgi:dTDP-3-amino-2,3,6-trideoxy-4-keto-D-glucose/dTDP-3-amino-3,4,6-trideoxy-alpha-D-glucose/dTDP-2,6-dideoxy-D-kanosamine transaminase